MSTPSAEEFFTEVFRRFNKNRTVVLSLSQYMEAVSDVAPQAMTQYQTRVTNLLANDARFRKIFGKADEPIKPEVLDIIGTQVTQMVSNNASSAIKAASLVFAQSIVDDAAWSYLKACSIVDPETWEGMLEDRKISFKEAKSKSYQETRSELIDAKLKQISRESLLSKIDLLFKICTPPSDFSPLSNYVFERDRIETIDSHRHSIIHESGFGEVLPTIAEDLDYLSKTAWYLMGLVNQRYGLKIVIKQFFNLGDVTPQELLDKA